MTYIQFHLGCESKSLISSPGKLIRKSPNLLLYNWSKQDLKAFGLSFSDELFDSQPTWNWLNYAVVTMSRLPKSSTVSDCFYWRDLENKCYFSKGCQYLKEPSHRGHNIASCHAFAQECSFPLSLFFFSAKIINTQTHPFIKNAHTRTSLENTQMHTVCKHTNTRKNANAQTYLHTCIAFRSLVLARSLSTFSPLFSLFLSLSFSISHLCLMLLISIESSPLSLSFVLSCFAHFLSPLSLSPLFCISPSFLQATFKNEFFL